MCSLLLFVVVLFFLNKLTLETLRGHSMAEARLSIASWIYKEKIRDDYTPTLPLSLCNSPSLLPSLSFALSLSCSPSLPFFVLSDPDDRTGRVQKRKGRLLVPAYQCGTVEIVDVHLCIFNSSAGDGNSAVRTSVFR